MGSLRVGHDWAASLSLFTFMHWRRKWQPTPVFLAWRIPGMGKPGGLLSMELHRVGHNWSDLAAAAVTPGWVCIMPSFRIWVTGTLLVVQWLGIHLPMQGTWVQYLVWDDPTCGKATKPVSHNYWASTLEPMLCNKRSQRSEKPTWQNQKVAPLTTASGSPLAATKTQCSQI